MFSPPSSPETLVYFGKVGDAAALHQGEDFSVRLESEIRIHQGQIQAENLLLNTVAKFQHIADRHGISREDLNELLREKKYNFGSVVG